MKSNKELSNGRTLLKKVEKNDYQYIYSIFNDFDNLMLWTNIREFSTRENFYDFIDYKINNEFSFYFLIQSNSGHNVGLIYIYDYNKIDNYAFISLYILPKFQNKHYAIDAYLLLFKFLHKYLPIRKLYLDVLSYNKK